MGPSFKLHELQSIFLAYRNGSVRAVSPTVKPHLYIPSSSNFKSGVFFYSEVAGFTSLYAMESVAFNRNFDSISTLIYF